MTPKPNAAKYWRRQPAGRAARARKPGGGVALPCTESQHRLHIDRRGNHDRERNQELHPSGTRPRNDPRVANASERVCPAVNAVTKTSSLRH